MSIYVAIDICNGEKVSNNMVIPFGQVTADTLDQYTGLGNDDVAFTEMTWDEIRNNIEKQ